MKELNKRQKRVRHLSLLCAVFVCSVFAVGCSVSFGAVRIHPFEVFRIIMNHLSGREIFFPTWETNMETIIWNIRLPRVVLAWFVGAGLSVCGVLMQALTKNALADPYVLGISSGASAGAVCAIITGCFHFAGGYGTMFGAICGAALAIVLSMAIATYKGTVTSTQLILAGIATSALFSGITNLIIYGYHTGSDKTKTAQYWMVGSLSGASWEKVKYVAAAFLITVCIILLFTRELDMLLLGDGTAENLGVNVTRIKMVVIIMAAVLTGIVVSVSGVIGFIGLVVPHIARRLVGSRHTIVLPFVIVLADVYRTGRFSLAGDCCTGGAPDRNYCGFVRRTVFPVPDPQGKEEEHMNHSFLTVRGLDYSIDGTEILQDVSLEVPEGTFVGLIGPNGCGKSTLLKNIYKTYRPQKDTVYIDGKDVVSLSAKEMARQAAVVAQENQTEFDLEVLDMVMYGRYAHRRFLEKETEEDLAICRRFLEEVGLKGYENRSFFSLSGGEKQRVLMARTLAQESRLILLDEPTNHLDIRFQYLLMEILKKQDATIFSSVHDLNIAAMYCDRILLMDRGRIIKAGTPEEILTEENILQIFGIHAQITKNPITQKIQVYYIPKG